LTTAARDGRARGTLLVLSGPSGCGKTTVVKALVRDPNTVLSVSATTRAPRAGEADGVDYDFLTPEAFAQRVQDGAFAEHKEVFGHRYGTPRAPLEAALASGRHVVVEIDVQGALELKKTYPDGLYVFLLPPSAEELRRRLVGRRTESPAEAAKRLEKAEWEMSFRDRYTHRLVNDRLEDTVAVLREMMNGPGERRPAPEG
jgi:guanylate kinase